MIWYEIHITSTLLSTKELTSEWRNETRGWCLKEFIVLITSLITHNYGKLTKKENKSEWTVHWNHCGTSWWVSLSEAGTLAYRIWHMLRTIHGSDTSIPQTECMHSGKKVEAFKIFPFHLCDCALLDGRY